MNNVIYAAIYFCVTLGAFLLGKYVFPKATQYGTNILENLEKMDMISKWADKFVVWAREFMKSKTGEEKMAAVVDELKEIADEAGLNMTEDQLKAIAQSAYEAMKAGEAANAATPLEAVTATPETTVVINTGTAAIATDNVPEDALKENPDGTVNVYDSAGKKVGTMPKEEAEAAASNVSAVVIEK